MKETVDFFYFTEQPYSIVTEEDLNQYPSGRLDFPNSHFDPEQGIKLYNQYHEQYASADQAGFDGIMTNEHHSSYWCMKAAVNLDAAVISKVTKNVKIAILGNVIAIHDPVRMAEELAILDLYSGGRSDFWVRSRAGCGEPPRGNRSYRELGPVPGSPRPYYRMLDQARPVQV